MPNDKGPNAQRIAFFFIHIELEYLRLYQFVKLEYLRLYQFVKFYYRPQRSCGRGYVFTRVCDSVHRGGLPQCMLGYCHPQEGGTPWPRRPPQKETPQEGGTPSHQKETSQEGGTPQVRRPPRRRHPCQGDPPPRRPPGRRTPKKEAPPAKETPQEETPPGPHPRRKLRGIMSRPTPKGEIEGDQIQAHTQGGN